MKRSLVGKAAGIGQAFAIILLAALPVRAEVTDIQLVVDGLACPFCVHGIRKKVAAVDGVESLEVSLKDGIISIVPSGAASPDPAALRDAIRQAGFTPGELRLTAIGTLAVVDDEVRLNVRNSDQVYLLFEQGVEPPLSLGRDLRERLLGLATADAGVRIRGVVHAHEGASPGLSVDAIEPLDE